MGCWLEVKPLRTAAIEPRNMKPILEVLYNMEVPFRFVMANCESTRVKGRRNVRFFMQLPDERLRSHVAQLLSTSMDVEVVEAEPPETVYEVSADLGLAKHYALPVCNLEGGGGENPVDGLVGALSGGGALEVLAVGDPKASTGIYKYINERLYGRSSFTGTLFDLVSGIFGQAFGGGKGEKTVSRRDDPWVKRIVGLAERKRMSQLFTCKIRVYGSESQVEAVLSSLPTAENRFKRRLTSRGVSMPKALVKPKRFSVKRFLHFLWWATPLLLLYGVWRLGVFNPLRLSPVDVALMAVAVIMAGSLATLLSEETPVILSVEELSSIVGLPSNIGRLPVEFGITPVGREPFASKPEEKPEEAELEPGFPRGEP